MTKVVLTPPINCEGLFSAKSPFVIDGELIYKCHAVHTLVDLKKIGKDVFSDIYKPKGLTAKDYTEDYELHASIVTLIASDGEKIYIPNTYINSYPGDSGVAYTRPVLICDLNMVPSYLDVTPILDGVKDLVKKTIGVDSTPYIPLMDVDGTVSNEKHVSLERTRIATIRGYVSKDDQITKLKATVTEQENTINNLLEVLKNNGIIT